MKNLLSLVSALGLLLALLFASSIAHGDCDTSPNSVGDGVHISHVGDVVEALGGPPEAFGALIFSPAQQAPVPFGNGLLCVQPFVPGSGRTQAIPFGKNGTAAHQVPLPFGSTLYVQLWYRDGGGGNVSNSIAIGGVL